MSVLAAKSKYADLDQVREKRAFICDIDGVITWHGDLVLPGARRFVDWLKREGKQFLFLTNSSTRSLRELNRKLEHLGMQAEESNFYTSALATASFLATQHPGGSAYVIGEAELINALYDAGYSMNETNPDYVVVGMTRSYSFEKIEKAVNLVRRGAKLIGTNPDVIDPAEGGVSPGTGALILPIEMATGRKAYTVGKPNPVMMRHALKRIGCSSEETVIIGDRMDTDIIAGINSDIETILVLTGVTTKKDLEEFAYHPSYVLDNVGEILE
jgi:NagD protein